MRAMAKTDFVDHVLDGFSAGHLIHDEAPQVYRDAVESFVAGLQHRP